MGQAGTGWSGAHIAMGWGIGALAVWGLTAAGFWPAPLVLSLLWALGVPTTFRQYAGAIAFSIAGYLIPLLVAALSEPIGSAAGMVAGIMGFGHDGVLVWGFTVILAALLAVAGAWVGHAVRVVAAAGSGAVKGTAESARRKVRA